MTTALKRLAGLFFVWLATFVTGLFYGGDFFWAAYWLGWFFVVFAIPEITWAIMNPRYTVSEETWRFESLHYNPAHPFTFANWTPSHWIFGVVYLLFAIALGLHLTFGIKLFFGIWG